MEQRKAQKATFTTLKIQTIQSFVWSSLHCPGKQESDGGGVPPCGRCTQKGWWWHSSLWKCKQNMSVWCKNMTEIQLFLLRTCASPAATAPTSGTRHSWTGLHQLPTINTSPRGSLTRRHSSSEVDCSSQTENTTHSLHPSQKTLIFFGRTILWTGAAGRNVRNAICE